MHLSGVLGVFIDSARHLYSADGALGGASDPYAVASWVGHRSKKVTRTRTVSSELCPEWNHAFVLPVPLLRPLHGGKLEVSVWDDDYFGSDDFLGRVEIDASYLVRQRTMSKVVLPLKARKKGERVQGTVTLRVFCPPGIMDLTTQLTAFASNKTMTVNEIPRCHVRLKIAYATGLRRADCCSTISGDPYRVPESAR